MSATVNKVILIGHLGDNVKMYNFENGSAICRFPLATNESFTNKNGEKKTLTEWHNICVKNKGAEICEKYLSKGDKVYIEGKIKTRSWVTEDGSNKYITEIDTSSFTFLSTKKTTEQEEYTEDSKKENTN